MRLYKNMYTPVTNEPSVLAFICDMRQNFTSQNRQYWFFSHCLLHFTRKVEGKYFQSKINTFITTLANSGLFVCSHMQTLEGKDK